jgi:hypothetical protein
LEGFDLLFGSQILVARAAPYYAGREWFSHDKNKNFTGGESRRARGDTGFECEAPKLKQP